MVEHLEERLNSALNWAAARKHVEQVVVSVYRQADGFAWTGGVGGLSDDDEFFIASTTKLMTVALILRQVREGRLQLDQPVAEFLPDLPWEGLHAWKGRDDSLEITVRHLLSQTSGVADYFQGKTPRGSSLEDSIVAGRDEEWDVLRAMHWAKEIGAAFPPGAKGKALYSDTGYQLLGALIEKLYDAPYRDVVRTEIVEPLKLAQTWVYQAGGECEVLPLRVGPSAIHVPLAMQSFGPDGGIVSTASDLMVFLRAFFDGRLFPQEMIPGLLRFNRLFFPLEYGVGLMRFRMPWIFSPFRPMSPLLGHSGLSGAFAFHAPDRGLFITGTVNQINTPGNSFQLMMRLMSSL